MKNESESAKMNSNSRYDKDRWQMILRQMIIRQEMRYVYHTKTRYSKKTQQGRRKASNSIEKNEIVYSA